MAIDVPGLGATRRRALRAAHACVGRAGAPAATLDDGTVRRSLAGGVARGVHGPLTAACGDGADADLEALRAETFAAARAFGDRLGGRADGAPVLATSGDPRAYATAGDVVAAGDHLDHFHSYRKEASPAAGDGGVAAIDFHVDQGLFVAFTPALAVGAAEQAEAAEFRVRFRDGSDAAMRTDSAEYDDAVFVALGDGVDRYATGEPGALRAAPHALTMFPGVDRAWYGLMVLPPNDALAPGLRGATFGDVRAAIEAGDGGAAALGCSAESHVARELAEAQCAADEMYCWYRCMPWTNHDGDAVSPEICADAGYDRLACTDIFRQPSPNNGSDHGDYYPQCTSYTHYTAPPSIAPEDADACAGAYDAHVAASAYAGGVVLVNQPRAWEHWLQPTTVGSLAWTLAADRRSVEIRHAIDGRVGWMAFGVETPGGKKNGMCGSPVIMSIPDAAAGGLRAVGDYRIDAVQSAFRHWSSATAGAGLANAVLEVHDDDCYASTTLSLSAFSTDDPFDADKCWDLIWAVNTDSTIVDNPLFLSRGKHEARGHISVNFSHPEGLCWTDPDADDGGDAAAPAPAPAASSESGSSGNTTTIIIAVVVAFGVLLAGAAAYGLYARGRAAAAAPKPVSLDSDAKTKADELELALPSDEETKA